MNSPPKRPPKRKRSRRSFGFIRRLPSGRYQASYTGPDGTRHTAPRTFDTKAEADQWLAAQQTTMSRDEWQPPSSTRKAPTTLDSYADAWLSGRDLKPRTRHHYAYLLDDHITPTLGELPLKAISPAAIREWYSTFDPAHPTVRAHAYALVKSILATAVEDELIARNPCRIRGASKSTRARDINPATLDELAVITANMPPRLQLLVPLSAFCALRFGEATELRRRDVDVKRGVLHIRRAVVRNGGEVIVDEPKRASVRDVAIPPHLIPLIKQHLREHAQLGDDGLLFYAARSGRQLPHSTLRGRFTVAAEAAGRPDLTPHALRHTGAVLAAQSGASLAELMQRLGHKTATTALLYQHASQQRDKMLAARLSELANGGG